MSLGGATQLLDVVWVDDRPQSVAAAAQRLRDRGWKLEVIHPNSPRIIESISSSPHIILDLRWSNLGIKSTTKPAFSSAKRMARYVVATAPMKPLLFCSNFFADQEYVNIEREISPAALTARVDKHRFVDGRPATERRSAEEVIVDEIDKRLRELGERGDSWRAQRPQIENSLRMDESIDMRGLFDVSLADYNALPSAKRLALARSAGEAVSGLVDAIFEQSAADWVVVGGTPPSVLLWGKIQDVVTDEELDSLAFKTGAVPFVFVRSSPAF